MMIRLPRDIEAKITEKEVIVLSDRYPPKSFGGAEVSLHNALASASEEFKRTVLVIFFDEDIHQPEFFSVDRISVLGLPVGAMWPFNRLRRDLHLKRCSSNWLYKHVLKYGPVAKDALRLRNFGVRQSAYYLQFVKKPRGGVQWDFLIDDRDYRVGAIKSVIKKTRCRKIVADNTRSIILGALAGSDVRDKVAVVRDNRFNCARHNQIMMIGDRHCGICDFGCAKLDAVGGKANESLHRKQLMQVQEFRTRMLKSYDKVVVTSHFLARNIRKLLGREVDVRRVPNPAGDFEQIMSYCRGVAESPRDDILIVGMLNEAKGQLELFKKALSWLRTRKNARLIFAGRGERTKNAILKLAEKNGVLNSVRFVDYLGREDLFKLMKTSKLILLPTRWKEPFGRVPIEAGLARKAVVSFAVGGICETIINDKTGRLVAPGDYNALFTVCDELLQDGGLRQRLGEAAFEHVIENYLDRNTSDLLLGVIIGEEKLNERAGRFHDIDLEESRDKLPLTA